MDNASLRARADELLGELNRLRGGLSDLQRKLRDVRAKVTSDDGLVTVTVGPRGEVVSVELDPRLYRRPDSKQLAATIAKTAQAAQAKAQEQVRALCRPFIPDADVQAHLDFDFAGMTRRLDHELGGVQGETHHDR